MNKDKIILTICSLFQLMFTYAAISKWMEFGKFKAAMYLQPIPDELARLLIYFLPAFEIIIVVTLFQPFQKYGLWLSALTMSGFTLYLTAGLLGFLGHMPCSCGGILGNLPITAHLIFNLIFLTLSILGNIIFQRKEVWKK